MKRLFINRGHGKFNMTILKTKSLLPDASSIVCHKSTERPFSGEYDQHAEKGSYLCRQCGLALFRSKHKFHSGCGWPSFDAEVSGAVRRQPPQQRARGLQLRSDLRRGDRRRAEVAAAAAT